MTKIITTIIIIITSYFTSVVVVVVIFTEWLMTLLSFVGQLDCNINKVYMALHLVVFIFTWLAVLFVYYYYLFLSAVHLFTFYIFVLSSSSYFFCFLAPPDQHPALYLENLIFLFKERLLNVSWKNYDSRIRHYYYITFLRNVNLSAIKIIH